ncbi:ribonuclease P protein component [Hoylesella oralis]|jgi:ribonuclease P protein component|uniref:ribonuclease P protein component n=1 Tax=Hoylesella oralis TaxID=28134 RepID=UPI0028E512AB|nr:ribonuclease P protein component [Hoylesella oralis]
MPASGVFTLSKEERICSRTLIESLFNGGGSHALSAYPLRVVYKLEEQHAEQRAKVQIMVSVSKKHFKHAVKRNRVKRQVREAYRKNKSIIVEKVPSGSLLLMAFIWLADNLYDTQEVEQRISALLMRIKERL